MARRADTPGGSMVRLTYTVAEAAQLLGIGTSTCWRLIHDGELPVVRLGRRTLLRRASLDALLAEREIPATHLAAEAALRETQAG